MNGGIMEGSQMGKMGGKDGDCEHEGKGKKGRHHGDMEDGGKHGKKHGKDHGGKHGKKHGKHDEDKHAHRKQMEERLDRIEKLLQQLVEKQK
jgi:hypothetical protein